ncbi:PrsW family intramembrane metalloprotease [Gryllotalpicola koreensis]|uniref:PrsW family intramembrane metalloprotease n=1 Tax=Gryllotalpicola koreensis TaxID=993086 RepID=A0ABP7ZU75_9MICO
MTDAPDRVPVPPEQPWQPPQPQWPQPQPGPQPPQNPEDWRRMYPPQPPAPAASPLAAAPKPPKPPRKWLGAWGGLWIALGAIGIIGLEFLVAWLLRDVQRPSPRDDDVLDPILLLVGSGCVIAGFLYTMAYRVPARWGLSIGRLVGGGLLAGFLAAVAAGLANGTIDAFSGGTPASPSTLTLVLVGAVEESCKLAAALVLGRSLPVKNGRVGLFVGAAVGIGFAAVENLGYLETAWSVGLAHGSGLVGVLGTSITRQLLGPFLHPVLTGMSTAAAFAVARNGRYRLTLGAVGAWLAVAVAHSLFDLGASAVDSFDDQYLGGGITLLTIAAYVIASFLAWLLISRALKRRDLARATPAPPTPPAAPAEPASTE